jgi:hypothetical protein
MTGAKVEERNYINVRSPSKVSDDVRILIESKACSAIVTIVRPNRGKAVVSRVCQILVLDTCDDPLEGSQQAKCVQLMHHILEAYVQPSRPPLPVAKNRPLQIAGSHISNVILERVEVGIERATRHRSAETT